MSAHVPVLRRRDGAARASSHVWGIVVAGASNALLRHTIERTSSFIARRRILTVTARRQHAAADTVLPRVQRVVQPSYRGSAAEIFLPALKIARHDPHATVVIVPSDLVIDHEARLVSCVERAITAVGLRPDVPLLLAAHPRTPEAAHGWIEPGPPVDGLERLAVRTILRFIERPSRAELGPLFEETGLVSTRIVVARNRTLIELGQRHLPEVLETLEPLQSAFGRPEEPLLCDALYECMPRASVWRALLRCGEFAVLPIPEMVGTETTPPAWHALAS